MARWVCLLGLLVAYLVPGHASAATGEAGIFGFTTLEARFFEALAQIVVACISVPLSKPLGQGNVLG
ncbi:MAG: hypothetical protein AAGK67_08380 [Pseudomonadota bacterium]